ncbi:MAG: ATPase [Brevundimonas sp.]|nr:MAG: ATPase [Brevundimonas sp.]
MLKSLLAAAVLAFTAMPAAAEVIERSADHFVLRYEVGLETTPEDLYHAIGEVGQWWDSAHTYSGDAANLTLPLQIGACFCERLADGTVFEHGRVTAADPETGVLLDAPLGPLKGKTTRADLGIGWSPANAGWTLVMTYVVRGTGVGAWADGVDAVMGGQFSRFSHFVEYGEAPTA